MSIAMFLVIIIAAIALGIWLGKRSAINAQINADIAFMRSIPSDVERGEL